jgi:predicted enzyme related to lactoylglutathione lyase
MALKIDYVEFVSPKLEETQSFFADAFGWSFIDYGPDYRDIQGAGLGGGIERGDLQPPLVVLKSDDLEADRDRLVTAGADLVQDIFEFPGGRRFEFIEPGGTRMAVWSTTLSAGA